MSDILTLIDDEVFSYRVAGICIQNGMVLLQKPDNDDGYAFPGGHVAMGETHAEALKREFQEEIGADISVGDLAWVGEIFFPWGARKCTQICLYYFIDILSEQTPKSGVFSGQEHLEGRDFKVEFYWVPLEESRQIKIYPSIAEKLLAKPHGGVQHFIDRQV